MTSRLALTCAAFALLAGACGPGAAAPSPTPGATATVRIVTPEPTPTPSPTPTPTVYWPLTGVVAEDAARVHRRPLNVRLPNDRAARPHVGLATADIVFEMIVEGGITRFAAIFHASDAVEVGPVRSYRFSDLHITQMLRGALVASGATVEERDAVTTSISAGNLISVDAQRDGRAYYRVPGRPGPNDLFANLDRAREAVNDAGGGGPVDVPPLTFLPPGDHDELAGGFETSVPATTVTIPFRGDPASFVWEPAVGGYRRMQGGLQTVDPDGNVPILARNVVVIWTDIWETTVVQDIFGSLGLDYRMTGGGRAAIFRDGRRVDGTWRRDSPLDMFTFHDSAGEEIALAPGQSWIHFVYQDWVVTHSP
ncbi:MAG: DUF3048 domain-containing protein [Candidatus Limnocylindria bacterium]